MPGYPGTLLAFVRLYLAVSLTAVPLSSMCLIAVGPLPRGAHHGAVAAIWLGRQARLRHRGYLVYVPWLAVGLAMAIMGVSVSLGVVGGAAVVIGGCAVVLGLAWTNTLQELVPRGMLGRVVSIDFLVSESLTPIGFGLAGIAADRIGAAPVFVVGGLGMAAVIGAGLLHPAVRAVD